MHLLAAATPAARRSKLVVLLLMMVGSLAACITRPPALGQGQTEVLRDWGPPTSRYALADGGQRLEYATGPYGRTTWMIDLDAGDRVTRARQVLNEEAFYDFQVRGPGMNRDDVLRTLGRPGERRHGWQGGEVWSWRYPTNDCLWFQASLNDAGRVTSGSYGIDPTCAGGGDGRN